MAFAAILRIWPLHHLASSLPWLTFYPAVVVAALYGGLAAGLLAMALSCLTVALLWPLLVAHPFITVPTDYVRMALFVLIAMTISCLTEAMFRATARAEKSTLAASLSSLSDSLIRVTSLTRTINREREQLGNIDGHELSR